MRVDKSTLEKERVQTLDGHYNLSSEELEFLRVEKCRRVDQMEEKSHKVSSLFDCSFTCTLIKILTSLCK